MSAFVCLVSHMSFSCCPYQHVDALDDTSAERMLLVMVSPGVSALRDSGSFVTLEPLLLTRNTFLHHHLDDIPLISSSSDTKDTRLHSSCPTRRYSRATSWTAIIADPHHVYQQIRTRQHFRTYPPVQLGRPQVVGRGGR
jgi:hypothetical protein